MEYKFKLAFPVATSIFMVARPSYFGAMSNIWEE